MDEGHRLYDVLGFTKYTSGSLGFDFTVAT